MSKFITLKDKLLVKCDIYMSTHSKFTKHRVHHLRVSTYLKSVPYICDFAASSCSTLNLSALRPKVRVQIILKKY